MGSAPAGGMANKVTGANAAAYQAKNPNVTSAKMTPKIQAHPVAYPTAATAPKLTSAHGGLGQGYQMSGKDGGPALPKPINWAALAPKPAVAAPVVKPAVAAPVVKPAKPVVPKKPVVKGAPPNATPSPANTSGYYLPGSSNLWFPGEMGGGSHGSTHNAAQQRAQNVKLSPEQQKVRDNAIKLANANSAAHKAPLTADQIAKNKRNALAVALANKKSAANKNKKKPKYTSSKW